MEDEKKLKHKIVEPEIEIMSDEDRLCINFLFYDNDDGDDKGGWHRMETWFN